MEEFIASSSLSGREVLLVGGGLGLALFLLTWFALPFLTSNLLPSAAPAAASEDTYIDPKHPDGRASFPLLLALDAGLTDPSSSSSVYLSVVVPAFNEAKRIPGMLDQALGYLIQRRQRDENFTFEVIVVDDGSVDATSTVVLEYTHKYGAETVRLCKLVHNNGKGGAVRKGMLRSRGRYLLMADADGATEFADLERLERGMKQIEKDGLGIVVGSRAHLVQETQAQRTVLRSVLMHGFHLLVYVLCVKGINDTQCGFKLFTRKAARKCFTNLHIQRWAFDCEVLFVARNAKIPIKEEAVRWQEIEGSKLNVATASIQMLRDLALIRLGYSLRIWKA